MDTMPVSNSPTPNIVDSPTNSPIMARCGRTAPHGGHWDHTNGRPCVGNLNIVTAVVSPMVSRLQAGDTVHHSGLEIDTPMDATPKLALHVSRTDTTSFGSAYQHLRAAVVTVADDGSPRNIRADSWSGDPERPYVGIVATAQADRDSNRADYPATYSYGWRLGVMSEYEPMSADILAAVLATLRKVERSMTRAAERYGAPATFGAYCTRVADALNVPILTGRSGADGMYSSGSWVEWKPGEAVGIIDGWTATFRSNGA